MTSMYTVFNRWPCRTMLVLMIVTLGLVATVGGATCDSGRSGYNASEPNLDLGDLGKFWWDF